MILLVVLALVGAGAAVGVLAMSQPRAAGPAFPAPEAPQEDGLPVLFEAPAFSLTATDGRRVTRDDLLGKVWIGNFIFTRCQIVCPVTSSKMADLQEQLRADPRWADLRLVSFSVDPEHDTPETLAAFSRRYEPEPGHWLFLTGDSERAVWSMVEDGFKLPVAHDPENTLMPISHSSQFVLVDASGRVRGFYGSMQVDELGRLAADALALAGRASP